MAGNTIIATDASRELLHRVAATPQFQKANRMRELLLYIGERSLQDPNCILHEQEIGVDVLGRQPDYDTSHDTLVRVLVSQLRKKLQEYFSGEGRNEPVIIEISKGSYVPVFRPRAVECEVDPVVSKEPSPAEEASVASSPPSLSGNYLVAAGVVAILIVVFLVLALVWALYHRENKPFEASSRPTVNAFWRQLFDDGLPTTVVLSDITLIPFEKAIGEQMPLSEYESREFERLADEKLKDPVRSLAKEVVNRVSTSVSDVHVSRDFGVLASETHLPLNLMSAREISSERMSSENSIVLGSWRANPWVGLFESQLNFRTEYHESPPSMRFVNTSPLKGEEAAYPAEWRRTGYCRVAYLPNPRRTGSVLLISGSDVISTEAGGRFLTTESTLRELRQKLGLKRGEAFPHFEILLRAEIVSNTVPSFELLAYRIHAR